MVIKGCTHSQHNTQIDCEVQAMIGMKGPTMIRKHFPTTLHHDHCRTVHALDAKFEPAIRSLSKDSRVTRPGYVSPICNIKLCLCRTSESELLRWFQLKQSVHSYSYLHSCSCASVSWRKQCFYGLLRPLCVGSLPNPLYERAHLKFRNKNSPKSCLLP